MKFVRFLSVFLLLLEGRSRGVGGDEFLHCSVSLLCSLFASHVVHQALFTRCAPLYRDLSSSIRGTSKKVWIIYFFFFTEVIKRIIWIYLFSCLSFFTGFF